MSEENADFGGIEFPYSEHLEQLIRDAIETALQTLASDQHLVPFLVTVEDEVVQTQNLADKDLEKQRSVVHKIVQKLPSEVSAYVLVYHGGVLVEDSHFDAVMAEVTDRVSPKATRVCQPFSVDTSSGSWKSVPEGLPFLLDETQNLFDRKFTKPDYRERFKEALSAVPVPNVSCGYQSFSFVELGELEKVQVGYSVNERGERLPTKEQGGWLQSWQVIGHENLTGDPIFVDTDDEDIPVFTAEHGRRRWKPELLSHSFSGFVEALQAIHSVSEDREHPAALENNPLPKSVLSKTMRQVMKATGSNSHYWMSWFTSE